MGSMTEFDEWSDAEIKKECFDPEELQWQSFVRNNTPIDLFVPSLLPPENVNKSNQLVVNGPRKWQDEMIDFSSNLVRQTQQTLRRIKIDFQKNGMKFDEDFRKLFVCTVTNR